MVINKNIANTPPVENVKHSQGNLTEVTLLRCFAVVSLVVWHTLCVYICSSWGGIESPMNYFYSRIAAWMIPEANMPLFTFIAGYLMGYQLKNKKYDSFKSFAWKKVHRLLVPYFILGALMVIIQPGVPYGWKGLIYGSPNHMWYCLMLFYCYILFYMISKYAKIWLNSLIAMLSLYINIKFADWGAIYHELHFIGGAEIAAYFYFWFWLGSTLYKHKYSLYSVSGVLVLFSIYMFTKGVSKEVAYVSLLLLLCLWISNTWKIPLNVQHFIERFAKCGFGIYVFHHLILWDASHINAVAKYIMPLCEIHYILMPISMFVITLGTSYLLTELSLRTKVGKYLLS